MLGKRFEEERRSLVPLRFDRFSGLTPKTIRMPEGELVSMKPLCEESALPLVVEPLTSEVCLVDWAKHNQDLIESLLVEHGGLLFRNFTLDLSNDFERFAAAICTSLFKDNGEHPRQNISGNVYTPIFYPSEKKVLWHNENSFNYEWPLKIWFGCLQPAREGGETPVVDSRKVYRLIDPLIRERFIEKGVMYVRSYGKGPGLDWQTVFKTTDRKRVEEHCRRTFMDYEWKDDGTLMTRAVRAAVARHPKTRETTWFNQAQHWHLSCLDEATRTSLLTLFSEEDLPRSCYYGDATPIEDSVMREILSVYESAEIKFAWQKGDIMLLDNVLTAHARNPYAGERKLLVTMGEMLSYADV
jgi:alpha-ketoglutarate-dependent taurine dioxygenase